MKLTDLKTCMSAVITQISGGKQFSERMDGFGLRVGKRIRVIRRAPFMGPMLLEDMVSGARIMIGRQMAAKIEVGDEETG